MEIWNSRGVFIQLEKIRQGCKKYPKDWDKLCKNGKYNKEKGGSLGEIPGGSPFYTGIRKELEYF